MAQTTVRLAERPLPAGQISSPSPHDSNALPDATSHAEPATFGTMNAALSSMRLQDGSMADASPSSTVPSTSASSGVSLTSPNSASTSSEELDETLQEALRSSRDRVFLLRQEQEMLDFVADTARSEMELPLMNSYQRLLVHRCADHFRLARDVDADTKAVKLSRTSETQAPSRSLMQIFNQANSRLRPIDISPFAVLGQRQEPLAGPSPASQRLEATTATACRVSSTAASRSGSSVSSPTSSTAPQSNFKIMRRDPSQGHIGANAKSQRPTSANSNASSTRKSRSQMTLEEREAAYREARERIFGPAEVSSAAQQSSMPATEKAGEPSTKGRAGNVVSEGYSRKAQQAGQNAESLRPVDSEDLDPALSTKRHAAPGVGSAGSSSYTAFPDPAASHATMQSWPQYPSVEQQQQQQHFMAWQQFQSQQQQGFGNYHYAGWPPQPPYGYPSPGPMNAAFGWPQGAMGRPHAGPSGSSAIYSNVDAFSPFPPTPSTLSSSGTGSVGMPSPAPSVVSSASASTSSAAGGRDEEQRRRSLAWQHQQQHYQGVQGNYEPQNGYKFSQHQPSLPPFPPQQHLPYGGPGPDPPLRSTSSSPISSISQRSDSERYRPSMHMPGSSQSTGRLNTGDRVLYDPTSLAPSSSSSPAMSPGGMRQGSSAAASSGDSTSLRGRPSERHVSGANLQRMDHGQPFPPTLLPPGMQPTCPGQVFHPSAVTTMPPYGGGQTYSGYLPQAMTASRAPFNAGGSGTASDMLGSSIRLGAVTPAGAAPAPPSPAVPASKHLNLPDGAAASPRAHEGIATSSKTAVRPMGASSNPANAASLPRRPDWVLPSSTQTSLPKGNVDERPNEQNTNSSVLDYAGTANSPMGIATPRTANTSIHLPTIATTAADVANRDVDDADDSSSVGSSSLGPSASASNVGDFQEEDD
ncbi:unnamed protein product [Jaminaea pallidilutea]